MLEQYRHGIESRAIDMFWKSRSARKLKPQPESIAKGAFALLAHGFLQGHGHFLREFASGVGFVDVGIILSSLLHIVEFKILSTGAFTGPSQLEQYLRNEGRKEGWLVVIDARPAHLKTRLPTSVPLANGRIAHVVVVDINPTAPSKVKA